MEDLKNESISYARIFSILNDWILINDNTFKLFSKKGDQNAKLFLQSMPKSRNSNAYRKIVKDLLKETLTELSYLCKNKQYDLGEYSVHLVTCLAPNEKPYQAIVNSDTKVMMLNYNKIIKMYYNLITEELNYVSNSKESDCFKTINNKILLLQNRLNSDAYEFKNIMGFVDENFKYKI